MPKAKANKTGINYMLFILIFKENCLQFDAIHFIPEIRSHTGNEQEQNLRRLQHCDLSRIWAVYVHYGHLSIYLTFCLSIYLSIFLEFELCMYIMDSDNVEDKLAKIFRCIIICCDAQTPQLGVLCREREETMGYVLH